LKGLGKSGGSLRVLPLFTSTEQAPSNRSAVGAEYGTKRDPCYSTTADVNREDFFVKEHLRDLKIEKRSIASLKPYGRNPRTHSPKQIQQIAASIEKFGFTNPVLIDEDRRVIAGHGRIEAAKRLGITEVPTIRLDEMTEAQKRAYVLADNKLAESAGWDAELLALELADITKLDSEFDLTLTGFESAEIDILLEASQVHSADEADNVPEIDDTKAVVTRPGDLWILGKHSLLCADATKADSFDRLLQDERADLVFVDPPYTFRLTPTSAAWDRSSTESSPWPRVR